MKDAVGAQTLPDLERRSRWLHWSLHVGLPVGISLLLHLAFFMVIAYATWTLTADGAADGALDREFSASIVDADATAQQPYFWPGEPVLGAPDPDNFADFTPTEQPPAEIAEFVPLHLDPARGPSEAALDPGGFGAGGAGRSGVLGIGRGAGEGGGAGFGRGMGAGADLAEAGLWDLRVPANHLVYVVDYSGSTIPIRDQLVRELKRSVGRLRESQQFDVIVYYQRGGDARADLFAPALQPATPDTKERFFRWVERKKPEGASERPALLAIRRALALEPQAIFFFSDGLFPDPDTVVREVRAARRGAGTQIHCLLFDELLVKDVSGLPPPLTDEARVLKRIAEESGGKFKIVTGADLTD